VVAFDMRGHGKNPSIRAVVLMGPHPSCASAVGRVKRSVTAR
jgi:hypothetical protein